MLLNELKPGLKYEAKESGDSPATKRFIMLVEVDNQTFEGSGASKKLAKQAAARTALTKLYNMTFTPLVQSPVVEGEVQVVTGKTHTLFKHLFSAKPLTNASSPVPRLSSTVKDFLIVSFRLSDLLQISSLYSQPYFTERNISNAQHTFLRAVLSLD